MCTLYSPARHDRRDRTVDGSAFLLCSRRADNVAYSGEVAAGAALPTGKNKANNMASTTGKIVVASRIAKTWKGLVGGAERGGVS